MTVQRERQQEKQKLINKKKKKRTKSSSSKPIEKKRSPKKKPKSNTRLKKRPATEEERQLLLLYNKFIHSCKELRKETKKWGQGATSRNSKQFDALTQLAEGTETKTQKMKRRLIHRYQFSNRDKKKTGVATTSRRLVESVLFYVLLFSIISIISSVLGNQASSGQPKNIGGYVPMTVLTKSMQSVYPQHAFIVAQVTDAKSLEIGEDITYIRENNTTVTHRIVGITENYMGTGKRGFETKGIENPRRDEDIVRSENVVGKVIFCNLLIGKIILFIRENMKITAVVIISGIFLIDALIKYITARRSRKK